MAITMSWDWRKNQNAHWLTPCIEAPYLAERWQGEGFHRALDLGCGLGRHSVYLARRGFQVTAADLSCEGVRHAREWAAREGVSLDARVCDMLDLPFAEASFDCAIAYNVIYHSDTSGFKAALRQLRRALVPGGELFMTLLSKSTWGFVNAPAEKRLDENALLMEEPDTSQVDMPHFFAAAADLPDLFADWRFAQPPREIFIPYLDDLQYYTTHWQLLLQKP